MPPYPYLPPACAQVETAAGIKEGGRTGLTAITIGVLFLCSVFLAPLFGKVTKGGTEVTREKGEVD